MKIFTFFLLLLCTGLTQVATAQQAADSLNARPDSTTLAAERAARTVAARKYVAVFNIREMIDRMGNSMANSAELTGEERADFLKYINASVNVASLEDMVLNATVNYFSVPEIEALTAFHATPEGKKVLSKLGPYLNNLIPAIQQEVVAAVQRRAAQK